MTYSNEAQEQEVKQSITAMKGFAQLLKEEKNRFSSAIVENAEEELGESTEVMEALVKAKSAAQQEVQKIEKVLKENGVLTAVMVVRMTKLEEEVRKIEKKFKKTVDKLHVTATGSDDEKLEAKYNAAMTAHVNIIAVSRRIGELSKHVAEVVKKWMADTGEATGRLAQSTKESAVAGLKLAWTKVKEAFRAAIKSVGDFAVNVAVGVKDKIENTSKRIGKAVTTMIGSAVVGLGIITQELSSRAANTAQKLSDIGAMVAAGELIIPQKR